MFQIKLSAEQAAAVRRLQTNLDFKTLCGIFQDMQDETQKVLREIEGPNLYRVQGGAQVLHAFLTLEDIAVKTLQPPTAPAARPTVDINFGQRDNPHFAKR
jgi:hypothetical protein